MPALYPYWLWGLISTQGKELREKKKEKKKGKARGSHPSSAALESW